MAAPGMLEPAADKVSPFSNVMPSQRALERLLGAVGLALFALFSVYVLTDALVMPLAYDDPYNASVAKNIAQGLGYGTSYGGFEPYNPDISTGPTLILPLAALIRIVGNTAWAPGLCVAAINLSLLAMIIYNARTHVGASFGLLACAAIPLLAIFSEHGDAWSAFLGDVVAGEFIVLGILTAPFEISSEATHGPDVIAQSLCAGLFIGLGVLTKFIAVVAAAVFLAVFAIHFVVNRRFMTARVRWVLVVLVVGALLPDLLFELSKLLTLGMSGYSVLKLAEHANFQTQNPPPPWNLTIKDMMDRIGTNGMVTLDFFEISKRPALSGILAAGWFAALVSSWRRGITVPVIATVLAGGAIIVCWFLLSWPMSRRMQPGLVLLLMGVAMWVVRGRVYSSFPQQRITLGSAGIAMLLLLSGAAAAAKMLPEIMDVRQREHTQNQALMQAVGAVELIRAMDPDARFCGGGHWVTRDIDYLLPGPGSFQDCSSAANSISMGSSSGHYYLVRRTGLYNWFGDAGLSRLASYCDRHIVFSAWQYRISRCGERRRS